LIFIIGFGMILSELKGTGQQLVNDTEPPAVQDDYYRQTSPPLEAIALGPVGGEDDPRTEPIYVAENPPARRTPTLQVVQPRQESGLVSATIRDEDEVELVVPQLEPVQPDVIEQLSAPAPRRESPARPSGESPRPPASADSVATYTVQPNDSLYRIAEKVYGQGDDYKRIFNANRDQLADEHSLRVGQVLQIPMQGARAVAGRSAPPAEMTARQLAARLDAAAGHPSAPTPQRRVYRVQHGDNLTRIARKVYRDDSPEAIRKIYRANKDKLADPDTVVVGMELEIPG
jgi:LysM repeat protein